MKKFHFIAKTFILAALFTVSQNAYSVARSWVGAGAGGAGTDFNTAANWSPAGVPTAADDLTMNLSSNATVTLSGSITVNSITLTVSGSNVTGVLDILTHTLTINAASTFSATAGNINTRGILHAGTNPGKVVFNGDVSFNPAGTALFKFRAAVTNPGSLVFMANLTTGTNAFTEPGDEPQFVFDKPGSQSWTFNSTSQYIVPESIIIGQSNTPTVSFTGSGTGGLLNVYNGVLTVSANCTLDIGKFGTDKLNGTGAVTLGANSFLRIGATNNFPTGFSAYTIDITNTVEFYGTGTTQDVGAMPGVDNYGNLILSGGGSKQQTSIGGINVRGNMTIAAGTTYYAWAELTTVSGTCTNNGTFNASTAQQTFNGNLANNGTWTQGTTASSIAMFSGTAAQTFSGTTTNTAFYRMTMNNTSATGLTLATPATVVAALTLTDGVVYTDATNLLILNDNCTSTSGSNASHVDGPMRKIGNDAFAFPTGDNGVWARIGISAPSNATHHFTAQYFLTAYASLTPVTSPIENVSSIEHWILNRTNGASNVNVTLYWEDGSRSGINTFTSDLRVARWDGSIWQDHGSASMTGSAAAGTVTTSAAVTSFSPFTFASISGGPAVNPLPVELDLFTARCRANDTEIHWRTLSEQNNRRFILSRSNDGINYTEIAKYDGAGTSNLPLDYFHYDNSQAVITYYRLEQEDYNGQITAFDPVSVNCGTSSSFTSYSFAQPGEIQTVITADGEKELLVELTDITGKKIVSKQVYCYKGVNRFSFSTLEYSAGIYFITLTDGANREATKLVIEK